MTDEARKALARLGAKLRLYARSSGHIQVIDSAAWDIVLLDLSEIERGFAELETDIQALMRWGKALIEIRAIEPSWENNPEWMEMSNNLRSRLLEKEAPPLQNKRPLSELMFTRGKRSVITDGAGSRFITMDKRVWLEYAEEVAKLETKFADVSNWAMEQQGRADDAEAEVQALEDLLGVAGNLLLETYGKMMEPLRERHAKLVAGRKKNAECTCSLSVRESGHDKNCPEYYFHQSGKPLDQIYIGVDWAHDEGDETCVVFNRKNDDGSATILAVLKGEAAEYVAELEESFNHLSHRFSCVLEHATGGRMSKTNYTKETMYRYIDSHIRDLCDEAVKELKDSLPKRNLRWDGERRDGEGAYICIYCDEELPLLGAIVHKADCIQATRF